MPKIRDYQVVECVKSVSPDSVKPVALHIAGMDGLSDGITVRPFAGSITTEWMFRDINSAKPYITTGTDIYTAVAIIYATFGESLINVVNRFNHGDVPVYKLIPTMGKKHGKLAKNEHITPDGCIIRTANGDSRIVAEWVNDDYYDIADGKFVCRRMTFAQAFHAYFDVAYAPAMEYARAHNMRATLEIARSGYGVDIVG